VRHAPIVDPLEAFQLDGFGPEVVEQTGSRAEHDRDQMDPQFVQTLPP
jgi:hypothetical protein